MANEPGVESSVAPPAADDSLQVEQVLLNNEPKSAQPSPMPAKSPSRSSLHSLINPPAESVLTDPVKQVELPSEDIEMIEEEAERVEAVEHDDQGEGTGGATGDEGAVIEEEEDEEEEEEEEEVEDEEEEDEEEDEEEEEDEDDSDSDGAESEDLEPIITNVSGPNGAPELVITEATQVVKMEQQDGDVTMTDNVTITTTTVTDAASASLATIEPAVEPAPNVLVAKKKKRQRSLSPEEELPPPPPPMRTIRLERPLVPDQPMIHWDILTEAQEKGMVPVLVKGLPVFVTDVEGGLDALGGALPQKEKSLALPISDLIGDITDKAPLGESSKASTAPLTDADRERLEMEALAKRFEDQYDKPVAKKRKAKGDDYDIRDDFIDDSELTIDRPTHYQKPKKEGFFVSQGAVELMEEPIASPKSRATGDKAKKKRVSLGKGLTTAAGKQRDQASPVRGDGSRSSPIRLVESDEESTAAKQAAFEERQRNLPSPGPEDKVDRMVYKHASRDKAYLPPFPTHHARLASAFRALRQEALKETWAERKKFPEHLKPLVAEAAKIAVELECFDESFFVCLPSLLPYNLFTLRKLSTRLSFDFHRQFLDRREAEEFAKFQVEVDKLTPAWRERHTEASTSYQTELEVWENGEAERARLLAENPRPYSTQDDTDIAMLPNANDTASDPRPKEPTTRFLFTEEMRTIFWVLLENASNWAMLVTAMQEFDPSAVVGLTKGLGSNLDLGKKKELYRKLCGLFPEGSMQTQQLSREMTRLKAKKSKGG